ncbi:hypothetical protein ACVWYS_001299 [Arthrobacter sp. TE12231]
MARAFEPGPPLSVRAPKMSVLPPSVTGMEHVMVKTGPDGRPQAVLRGGREWLIGAEPVRWFERVNWWEAERRMPKGLSRVDVEVWQIQARLGRNRQSALTTMEIVRDGLGGGWRLREAVADAA